MGPLTLGLWNTHVEMDPTGTVTNLAASAIPALWPKKCPDIKIFLGEFFPPPSSFIFK